MVIQEAHRTINALRQALPRSFVFVIDTTDRSFIYKSSDYRDCERVILNMDSLHGIDSLSKEKGYYFDQREDGFIGLRNLSSHTYIGFCLPLIDKQGANISVAEQIIRNDN